MTINLDILGTIMKHNILSDVDVTLIITIHGHMTPLFRAKLNKLFNHNSSHAVWVITR